MSAVGKVDPFSMVIDSVVNATLGDGAAAEAIKGAAKLAAGIATGDFICGLDGALDICDAATKAATGKSVVEQANAVMGNDAAAKVGYTPKPEPVSAEQLKNINVPGGATPASAPAASAPAKTEPAKTEPAKTEQPAPATGAQNTTPAPSGPSETKIVSAYVNQAVELGILDPKTDLNWNGTNLWSSDRQVQLAQALEHKLRTDPAAKAKFEQMIGGKIAFPGKEGEGFFTVTRPSTSAPAPTNTVSTNDEKCGVGGEYHREKRDANRFKGLSAEEIVEMLMSEAMADFDDAMVVKAGNVDDAQNRVIDTQAGVTNSDGSLNKDGQKANSVAKKDSDRLQQELTTLLERRKQMFDMLSNFSKLRNEMASKALSNMGAI